ncbi:MAG: bifunctional UDP-3-O-[3-hydroxymyristoyl] N-acetylglucosamine deacetylase/3-hydroxyacyl-ACP dehydratase [Verrucomicrobiae bacterium]|nr:bifunctional UDP-3-O-[3-hydroxymyristoyl] N-acetylglucosamine deacetylase/3-hydroxyacyl-ACP dehydratase [Verrucomicrobiae bacterium]
MFEHQKSVKRPASVEGVGLHTGAPARLTFQPAPANSGIQFARTDLPGSPPIPALVNLVKDTRRGTTLELDGVSVQTVEHVLAALAGRGIDNCLVEISGPEPPILDGSARAFSAALKEAGVENLNAKPNTFSPEAPVWYAKDGATIVLLPSDRLRISCSIHFPGQKLESQHYTLDITDESFETELASARTFCFYEEVKPLLDDGLIKGGSLECAVVIKDDEILSKEALRFRDEFVRHKMLDILGDVTLLGRPLAGHIVAVRPGHAANVALTQKLFNIVKKKRSARGYLAEGPTYEQMDIQELLATLPHRYPFLLVDRILKIGESDIVGLKNVTINEPFFQGHFPGHPIMPGVLQVEAMAQVAGILMLRKGDSVGKLAYFMSADKVKFRKPVTPGDTLFIEVALLKARAGRIGRAQARCLVDNEVVSEAELMFSIVDRASADAPA